MTSFFSSSYCHLGKNLLGFALAASASIAIARHGGMRTLKRGALGKYMT
jgi:hypothetical protein